VLKINKEVELKFGAVWLRTLTNLEVPFGAGACTLDLCRFIWCGECRSAVKVSTLVNGWRGFSIYSIATDVTLIDTNPPPHK
jgi:hypothetical protein